MTKLNLFILPSPNLIQMYHFGVQRIFITVCYYELLRFCSYVQDKTPISCMTQMFFTNIKKMIIIKFSIYLLKLDNENIIHRFFYKIVEFHSLIMMITF